ncbi:MAG TPA: biopolymer transporter ExbD [Planctomycetaceae bacterium]|nr:biopolymer transporter ExbD [Planctomycetaceae bacterium]
MRFRIPQPENEPLRSPQIVVALLATLMLLCYMASVQSRLARANERVKLPRHMLAKLPPAAGREEILMHVAFPENTTPVRSRDIPLVTIGETSTPLDRIATELSRIKREHQQHDPVQDHDHVTVVIRAEEDIPAGAVQQLVKACQDAGFTRFSLKAAGETP